MSTMDQRQRTEQQQDEQLDDIPHGPFPVEQLQVSPSHQFNFDFTRVLEMGFFFSILD